MSRNRTLVLRILRVLIAAAILWSLLRMVPLGPVLVVLRGARPLPVLVGLALSVALHFLVAERWRRILVDLDVRLRWRQLLVINLTALYYGLFLPAGNVTGFLVRFARVPRGDRSWAVVLLGLLEDRTWATGSLALLGLGCALAAGPEAHAWGIALGLVTAASAAGLTVLTRGLGRSGEPRWGRFAKGRIPVKVREALRAVEGSRVLFGGARRSALALSLASHVAGLLAYVALGRSVGLEVPLLTMGWIRSATILVTMLPVSILGLGLREGTLLLLLRPFAAEPARILAFSALVFGVTVLAPALLGGVIELCRMLGLAGRRTGGEQAEAGSG